MSPNFFDRTLFQWAGYILLFSGFLLIMLVQFGLYIRLLFLKKVNADSPEKFLSLLLTVRNEEGRIEKILTQLLNQNYQNYEVVVVDDFSEDATLTIVGVMAKKYPRLKFSSLNQEARYSEKISINLALKAATSEWVVFVSPETVFFDPDYLKRINEENSEPGVLALNYVNFEAQRGFYNRLCRVERFWGFLTSAAWSTLRLPVFYQQNNILFQKQIYFDQAGFRGKMNDHFANLELIFNQAKSKVQVCLDAGMQLREDVQLGKAEYMELVRKKFLLNRDLGFWKRLVLSLEPLSILIFQVGLIWLLVTEIRNWLIFVWPVVVITFIQVFVVKTLLNRLSEKKIFLSSLAYVFAQPVLKIMHRFLIYMHVRRSKWN